MHNLDLEPSTNLGPSEPAVEVRLPYQAPEVDTASEPLLALLASVCSTTD